jgi:hypothetical protein
MKRSIEIEGIGKVLELSKVVEIDTKIEMINIEKVGDGTWRLIYSKSLIPDIQKVKGFKIVREE